MSFSFVLMPGRSESHAHLAESLGMWRDDVVCFFSPPERVPMLKVEGPRRSDLGQLVAESSFRTFRGVDVALLPRCGYPEWQATPCAITSKAT